MWNISHPDNISKDEYELYDAVCIGSRYYADKLKEELKCACLFFGTVYRHGIYFILRHQTKSIITFLWETPEEFQGNV